MVACTQQNDNQQQVLHCGEGCRELVAFVEPLHSTVTANNSKESRKDVQGRALKMAVTTNPWKALSTELYVLPSRSTDE